MKLRNNKIAPYLIGTGLVLFVIHNPYQPLLNYAFLPWIGVLLIIFGSIMVLQQVTNWKEALGERKIWIPLGVIIVSIIGSGIEAWVEGRESLGYALGVISTAVMFSGLYIASRQVGSEKLFKPFMYAAIIESVSIIAWAGTHGWLPNGGLVSPTNYDMATGVVVFGVLVSPKRHQWWLASIGTAGLLFSGSAEAIFVGIVLLGYTLVSRVHWNIKTLAPVVTAIALLAIMLPTGIIIKAQRPNIYRVAMITGNMDIENNSYADRLYNWKVTMPIKPFGYGLNLTRFYKGIPHNIVLIIIEQVGILALLAWLWIAWLGVKKKGVRYLWIGFVALGVFDHFIWTQAAPWFWVLAGTNLVGGKT